MKSFLQKRMLNIETFSSVMVAFVLILGAKAFWIGNLVQKFGLSKSDAVWAVTALSSGGSWLLITFFPVLAPYLLTLRGLIVTIGAGAAAGW